MPTGSKSVGAEVSESSSGNPAAPSLRPNQIGERCGKVGDLSHTVAGAGPCSLESVPGVVFTRSRRPGILLKLPKPKSQAFLSLHHNHFSGSSILPPSPLPHNSSLRLIAPTARPHNAGHSSFFQSCFPAGPACSSPRGCQLDRLRRASAAPFLASTCSISNPPSQNRCYSTAGDRVAKYNGTKDSNVCFAPRFCTILGQCHHGLARGCCRDKSLSLEAWLELKPIDTILIQCAGQFPRQLD